MSRKNTLFPAFLLLSSACCLFSCSDDSGRMEGPEGGGASVSFSMTKSSGEVIRNSQVYLFDGEGSQTGRFRREVTGIVRGDDKLTMDVETGKWEFVLLSAPEAVRSKLQYPTRSQTRAQSVMWKTEPEGGLLPDMPELLTAHILPAVEVKANRENTAAATLAHNSAKVMVLIDTAGGLDLNGEHILKLENVPTTLNWDGGLYPDKNSPAVSDKPMQGRFRISPLPEPGMQRSDTLSFIIPAHKGSDWNSASPQDTTTSHLQLSLDLAYAGGERFQKTVTLPRVPRMNGTLLVSLTLGGRLEVSTQILPWKEETGDNAVVPVPYVLVVGRDSLPLSHKKNVSVAFSGLQGKDYTVEVAPEKDSDGNAPTWLSVRKSGDRTFEVTADVNTYVDDHPRKAYILVKYGLITKRIPVLQRPDEGTISVDKPVLTFCPVGHKTQAVKITSPGGNWKFITSSPKAMPNVQTGASGATVTFTRASTTNEHDYSTCYGNGQIVVKNLETLDRDTIQLRNCFIDAPEEIMLPVPRDVSVREYEISTSEITPYGGRGEINIPSNNMPSWVGAYTFRFPDHTLILKNIKREPNDEYREDFMDVAHSDCPDYKVKVKLIQDIVVLIDPFHYFVLQFDWSNNDVDFAVGFENTGRPYDNHYVGYDYLGNISSIVLCDNQKLIEWGGDARAGEGETVFFNAPVLDGDNAAPRKIKLEVYAMWWYGNRDDVVTFSMFAYRGGTMSHQGTKYYNSGGVELYKDSYKIKINPKGSATTVQEAYTHVATITYDRVKHSASVKLYVTPISGSSVSAAPAAGEPALPKPSGGGKRVVHVYSDDYRGERIADE